MTTTANLSAMQHTLPLLQELLQWQSAARQFEQSARNERVLAEAARALLVANPASLRSAQSRAAAAVASVLGVDRVYVLQRSATRRLHYVAGSCPPAVHTPGFRRWALADVEAGRTVVHTDGPTSLIWLPISARDGALLLVGAEADGRGLYWSEARSALLRRAGELLLSAVSHKSAKAKSAVRKNRKEGSAS